ncbi:hypothetical protein Tco_0436094 [Tanacetum coccineum]
MLATRGSGKVTTMEARANKTKGIGCLERSLLGQSARKHMLDLYLCATSANFTIIDRALKKDSTPADTSLRQRVSLDNNSKNNQNQQQPNKWQNIGRAYTARHGEKKHYGGSELLCSKCNYLPRLHVLPNATSATELTIWPMTVGALQMSILLTTKEALGQVKRLLAMNV